MRLSHTIGAVVLIVLTSLAFAAQTVSQPTKSEPLGKLSGLILDPENARVARAKIIVEGEGFRREATAADDGSYEIDLPVNNYTVIATGDGFQPTREANVQIRSDAVTSLNMIIKAGLIDGHLVFEGASTETAVPNNSVERVQDKPILSVKIGRYRLQSNLWVNLHQRLLYAARFEPTAPASLSGDELAKWNKAVETYRTYLGKRSPIFDDELIRLNAALSATSTSKLPASLPRAATTALESAMPLYRIGQWDEDDRANRFWIAMAEPLLVSAAEDLAAAHEKAYGVPFPKDILVDVSPFGWEFGAYTVGEGAHAHVVVTSTEPGYQGFAALEMLMHEPSHAIVDGNSNAAIGADLARASRELNIRPYSNLWHAILFYTSGELTRRALAKRGVRNYQPVILGMYERGYRGYKQSLETHWQAYLDGKVSREAAIRQIVLETAPPKK